MTLNWIKNIILFVFLDLLALSSSAASDRINGSDIKTQAAIYFFNHGLNLKLALSDKRTFFPCSTPLTFDPRHKDDWSTVRVSCDIEGWNVFIRSTNTINKSMSLKSPNNIENLMVAVSFKNIPKGQVITKEYLQFEKRPERTIHGAYTDITEVLGRKAKSNIAAGTILKARHLDTTYSVEKNDSVLVVAENQTITITTSAIALEKGQIGDMIPVKNVNSEKVFKVIITGKKKVAPITNM